MGKGTPDRSLLRWGSRPAHNPAAAWQPTPMKIGGVRVWSLFRGGGQANLHRAGRYGREFVSWNVDGKPNYIN